MVNKETKEYFEKNPELLQSLVKASFEEALKRISGKPVQVIEKPKESNPK